MSRGAKPSNVSLKAHRLGMFGVENDANGGWSYAAYLRDCIEQAERVHGITIPTDGWAKWQKKLEEDE